MSVPIRHWLAIAGKGPCGDCLTNQVLIPPPRMAEGNQQVTATESITARHVGGAPIRHQRMGGKLLFPILQQRFLADHHRFVCWRAQSPDEIEQRFLAFGILHDLLGMVLQVGEDGRIPVGLHRDVIDPETVVPQALQRRDMGRRLKEYHHAPLQAL